MKKKFLLSISCLFATIISFAQQLDIPLSRNITGHYEKQLNKSNSNFHTAVKPFLFSEVEAEIDKLVFEEDVENKGDIILNYEDGFQFGLRKGDIIQYNGEKSRLGLSPLVLMSTGYDFANKDFVFETGVGLTINANMGKKVSAQFSFMEYWGQPNSYIRDYIQQRNVVPGFRKANLNGDTYNSRFFEGYLSYTPVKHFNLQAGYGKHFWGDGYRSMMLSDNAPHAPYLKLTTNFWKIKYVYLFNIMKSNPYSFEDRTFDFDKINTKFGVYHYLSIDIAKWMQFGFFEGVIWEQTDSLGRTRGMEWNYLNPVAFIRPVEFALGSPDNIILGFNMKFKAKDRNQFYTQFVIDDLDIGKIRGGKSIGLRNFYRTKLALQLGHRVYDAFGVQNLNFQTEWNMARPYTYAHKEPGQNYAHLNQELAHPLGANFWELISIVDYNKNNFFFHGKFQFAKMGMDDPDTTAFLNPNLHTGSNIFPSDFEIGDLNTAYNNPFLQGVETNLVSTLLTVGYIINPQINLSVSMDYFFRSRKSDLIQEKTHYLGLTFKTNLFNRYTDF